MEPPPAPPLADPHATRKAVLDTKPDAIVHQATALAGLIDFRHFDQSFTQTNRLRTEGTDALLAAAEAAGVGRFRRPELRLPSVRTRGRAD